MRLPQLGPGATLEHRREDGGDLLAARPRRPQLARCDPPSRRWARRWTVSAVGSHPVRLGGTRRRTSPSTGPAALPARCNEHEHVARFAATLPRSVRWAGPGPTMRSDIWRL